jgi:hypothetical protein
MHPHRVRRLAEVLVASQMRAGRSTSNPRSFFGRGIVIAIADAGLFLAAVGVVTLFLGSLGLTFGGLVLTVNTLAPLLPLVAVAATLIAGVMFELTTTARFSSSDAANWLPLTPTEYVAGSAVAIAYSYSPGIALLLGALLPIALAAGLFLTFVLAAGLTVLGLLEGAVLVEMVRAIVQRTNALGSGRHARLAIVVRAALLAVLVLVFDLAFNPIIVLGFVRGFSSFEWLTSSIPLFWSTRALVEWSAGAPVLSVVFALAQLGFVALLLAAAGVLRGRYWVPNPTELTEIGPSVRTGHPYLAAVGLSAPEAAIASKDLRGFVRRRELLPTLVVPVVLILLLVIEGSMFGRLSSILWVGWVIGFYALLLSETAVGQERRSLQSLYAYPITGRAVLRAKVASVLVPVLIAAFAFPLTVSVLLRFPVASAGGFVGVCVAAAVVLVFWGLAFAARYSDFQERPRPQYLRPGAMLIALGSGMVILFAILVPAAFAFLAPTMTGSVVDLALGSAAAALIAGALAVYWARRGFDELFRQLPF